MAHYQGLTDRSAAQNGRNLIIIIIIIINGKNIEIFNMGTFQFVSSFDTLQ